MSFTFLVSASPSPSASSVQLLKKPHSLAGLPHFTLIRTPSSRRDRLRREQVKREIIRGSWKFSIDSRAALSYTSLRRVRGDIDSTKISIDAIHPRREIGEFIDDREKIPIWRAEKVSSPRISRPLPLDCSLILLFSRGKSTLLFFTQTINKQSISKW